MRRWKGVLLGVVAYLLFLVGTAPAARILPFANLEGVQFSGVDGSIWFGSADTVTAPPLQLQQVQWRFHPLSLITGRAEATVVALLLGKPLSARLGTSLFGSRYLADVNATVVAAELTRWLRLQGQVSVAGDLAVDLDSVQWPEGEIPQITGKADWTTAQVDAPLELSLGTVQLDVEAEDGVTRGKLSSSGGALRVDADVELAPDGVYRMDARIQQTGEVPEAVVQFLSTLAEFRDGTYLLEWEDRLPGY
jgi:general secretion pathway protein N